MPGKMCHDVSGDKKSIGNWQMETAVSRDGLGTFWHQSGTAKMGGDAMSVVDGQLKIYGVDGFRIADASIMPRVTTVIRWPNCWNALPENELAVTPSPPQIGQ